MTTRQHLKRKEVDDVMGGEESWKNVDSTDGTLRPHTDCFLVDRMYGWGTELTLLLFGVLDGSAVSEVRESKGLLHAATDPVRRRA